MTTPTTTSTTTTSTGTIEFEEREEGGLKVKSTLKVNLAKSFFPMRPPHSESESAESSESSESSDSLEELMARASFFIFS